MSTRLFPRCPRPTLYSAILAASIATCLIAPSPAKALTFSVWDNSSGNWSDGTHWSTNPAFPNNGGGITYDATVNGGAVAVDGNFTVTNFTLTGGILDGGNTLAVSGALNFNGGSFGDATATGATSGALAMDFTSGNQGFINEHYTLTNIGSGTWTGSGPLYSNGTFANSGTFNIQNDQGINNNGLSGIVSNTGTITKTVATGTTTIASAFNNTGGSVNVQSGTISLAGGGAATANASFGATSGHFVSFDSGTFSMAGGTSFTGPGVSRVAGGTVNVNGPATATNFSLVSGTVAGNGTLTASGTLAFNGGSFGDATTTGATSGALAMDFSSSGDGFLYEHYTLINSGTGSWTGTGPLFNSGTFANSGTFNIQNDQGINNNGVSGIVSNTGTINKTVSAGTTVIQSAFNNTGGSVNVQIGTLSLTGGGAATANASFGATIGNFISFDSGTFNMEGGTSFAGTGVNKVAGGTVNINGPATATNFTLISGTVAGNGTLTASGALSFVGGNFGDATATGATSGGLTMTMDFSSSGGGFLNEHYTLTNTGAGTWTGSGPLFNNGTFANTGILNIENDQGINNNGISGIVSNTGTINKTVATGTTTIQSAFNNTGGSVNVQSGTISLAGGGAATANASFGATSGHFVSFDSGTFSMAGGTSFTGTGVSRVAGGTVNINGPVTATNFSLVSGTVAGNGTLTASGTLAFNGGSFGDATITGAATGPLAMDFTSSGDGFLYEHYTLTNSGSGTWTGSGPLFSSGTFANSGTFNVQNDQAINNNGVVSAFNNTGTLIKSVATGTTSIQSTFNNTGGTVDVQSGTISLQGTVTNFNGVTNTLTGGTWKATGAGSTLSIDSGGGGRAINTLTGGADVTVGNSTATVTGLAVTSIGSGSALRSTGGATVTTGGALTNSGTVEAGTGSTLDVKSGGSPALYTQSAGHLLLTGGIATASAYNISGGDIEGSGSLNGGNVTASGTTLLSPGQSIGRITVGNDYSQTAGTGFFEVGRSGGFADSDTFGAQGNAAFSNVTFTLALASGSDPLHIGDTFTLLQSDIDNAGGGSLTMTNDNFVMAPSLAPYTLESFSTPTSYGYHVTGVPEPGTNLLEATGLLGLFGFRRRKRV